MKYQNPIIEGFYPDPSVCRVGEDYYLITSSFEYFPGIPIFHSKDLVNWKQIGHCLTTDEQLPIQNAVNSYGIYAPTIRFHNGRFYVIATNVTNYYNFIVWSENPKGPWSDPIKLEEWDGIDPSLFLMMMVKYILWEIHIKEKQRHWDAIWQNWILKQEN